MTGRLELPGGSIRTTSWLAVPDGWRPGDWQHLELNPRTRQQARYDVAYWLGLCPDSKHQLVRVDTTYTWISDGDDHG